MAELSFPDPMPSEGAVVLRPWVPDDLAWVVGACQDPEVSRYSPVIPFPYTRADADAWFASQEPARLGGQNLDFAVVHRDTGQLLGAISLTVNARLLTAETGYWLAAEARGSGHMTSAVRALARWGFAELGLARLWLTTDLENLASQHVAERCGFRREGHLRAHMLVGHSGERRDSLVWGLLPHELALT
jgi:RimJ/RimL family protein N-acetyltransferase